MSQDTSKPTMSHTGTPQEKPIPQQIPLKVYRSDDRLMVAAPMPGIEAGEITVEVMPNNRLVIHADVRGMLKGVKELLLDEWTVGGYDRTWRLPLNVNAALANVTYGNGVLVLNLPLSDQTTPARLTLQQVGSAKAERVGNAGHPIQPSSTGEHLNALASEQLANETLQA